MEMQHSVTKDTTVPKRLVQNLAVTAWKTSTAEPITSVRGRDCCLSSSAEEIAYKTWYLQPAASQERCWRLSSTTRLLCPGSASARNNPVPAVSTGSALSADVSAAFLEGSRLRTGTCRQPSCHRTTPRKPHRAAPKHGADHLGQGCETWGTLCKA